MEVIGQNTVTKGFFDLEIYVSLAQEYVQQADEAYMQKALALIERDFPGARCFCTAKFTTSKLSVHVILPNYKADFDGRCKLKLLALTDEYAALGFDASIYSIAVRFKGPNQSKGDGRVHGIIQNSEPDCLDIGKYLLRTGFDADARDISRVIDLEVPLHEQINITQASRQIQRKTGLTKSGWQMIVNNLLLKDQPYPEGLPAWDDCIDLQRLQILICPPRGFCVGGTRADLPHSMMSALARWAKAVGISWADFWAWAKQKDATIKHERKRISDWNSAEKYGTSFRLPLALAQQIYGKNLKRSTASSRMIDAFAVPTDKLIEGRRYLRCSDISRSCKTSLLASPCGSGKTKAVLDLVHYYTAALARSSDGPGTKRS